VASFPPDANAKTFWTAYACVLFHIFSCALRVRCHQCRSRFTTKWLYLLLLSLLLLLLKIT